MTTHKHTFHRIPDPNGDQWDCCPCGEQVLVESPLTDDDLRFAAEGWMESEADNREGWPEFNGAFR